jgi:hypothetical protein
MKQGRDPFPEAWIAGLQTGCCLLEEFGIGGEEPLHLMRPRFK